MPNAYFSVAGSSYSHNSQGTTTTTTIKKKKKKKIEGVKNENNRQKTTN